jgi:molybdopterin converting factor small subunit
MMKSVRVDYYAAFRERRGCQQEVLETAAVTPLELYTELRNRHDFPWSAEALQVAVNDEFCSWSDPLSAGDRVAFISPVSGG